MDHRRYGTYLRDIQHTKEAKETYGTRYVMGVIAGGVIGPP